MSAIPPRLILPRTSNLPIVPGTPSDIGPTLSDDHHGLPADTNSVGGGGQPAAARARRAGGPGRRGAGGDGGVGRRGRRRRRSPDGAAPSPLADDPTQAGHLGIES